VFNDLFCLARSGVHTISVGASRPEDLTLHLEAVALLDQASLLLPPILERLERRRLEVLGNAWLASWWQGLPEWSDTPGEINLPVLLWLHNLLESWGMEGYARARYGLLGNAGHWFPGRNADALDTSISEAELAAVLETKPLGRADPLPAAGSERSTGGRSDAAAAGGLRQGGGGRQVSTAFIPC
jgi:predicted aldo/keto reductase-like oxidoreductase